MTASLCLTHVDPNVVITKLDDLPAPTTAVTRPYVIASERSVVLGYYTCDDEWAIVQFQHCTNHAFGSPNDEAIDGHPLYQHGLENYDCYEIKPSPWLHALEKANRVHSGHDIQRFLKNARHYIFTCHDSTFECIAHGYTLEVIDPETIDPIKRMIQLWQRDN